MKEYVMNDLLNIDSRNQDGSATEDIDANMEEFLRIPSKLEMLLLFSLAVCLDSFLYAWAMLPLKFVWGVVFVPTAFISVVFCLLLFKGAVALPGSDKYGMIISSFFFFDSPLLCSSTKVSVVTVDPGSLTLPST